MSTITETPKAEILAGIAKVKSNADKWKNASFADKLGFLCQIQDNLDAT
jgi:hypothetical protein